MTAETLETLLFRGDQLVQERQFGLALEQYLQAIALAPTYPQPHFRIGNLLFQLEQYARAIGFYDQVIALMPEGVDAMHNRAAALQQLGEFELAMRGVEAALKLAPDMASLHHLRGSILQSQMQWEEALKAYLQALARDSTFFDSHNNCGSVLRELGRLPEAIAACEAALVLRPESPEAMNNLANCYAAIGKFAAALECCDRGLKLAPQLVSLHLDRAGLLYKLERVDDALDAYAALLAFAPDCVEAHGSIGALHQALGHHELAAQAYDVALKMAPHSAFAQFNKATHQLLLGDFTQGWKLFESRWLKDDQRHRREFAQPLWLGNFDIAGKTILLHAEQGLGDTLQFCRYAPMVAALGARVVLEVHPPLVTLVRTLAPEIIVIARGEKLPDFDAHCPLMSLPLAFVTTLETVPNRVPYLTANRQKLADWQQQLGPQKHRRIGLAWSGASKHKNDALRSLSLKQLAPLWNIDAEFHCLQKELRAEEMVLLKETPMHFYGDQLHDLDDTAALTMAMDMVISVDTSIVHLAGALNKPVWALLAFAPDHRWLLEREDSPWYPGVRLLRQTAVGDWSPVIARVAAELENQMVALGNFASAGRM